LLCEDAVALALKYNELSLENENPANQLLDFIKKPLNSETKHFFEFDIIKNGELIINSDDSLGKNQLNLLLKNIPNSMKPSLLGLMPERFVFRKKEIKKGHFPLALHYELRDKSLSFNLPSNLYYFKEPGIIFNTESAEVNSLSAECEKILSILLDFRADFNSEEELYPVIQQLSDRISSFFLLSGTLNIGRSTIDKAQLKFIVDFTKNAVKMKCCLETETGEIIFKPQRNDANHTYTSGSNVIYLSTFFAKQIKSIAKEAGFKISGDEFSAPAYMLSEIIAENGILAQNGKIQLLKEIEKLELTDEDAEKLEISLSLNPEKGWFSFDIKFPEHIRPLPSESLFDAIKQIEKGREFPVVQDSSGRPVILEKSAGFLRKIWELYLDGSIKPGEKIANFYLPHILKRTNTKNIDFFDGTEAELEKYHSIINALSTQTLPEIELDASLKTVLRHYQQDGVKWISLLQKMGLGGILADEMGLGKTLQSLAFLQSNNFSGTSIVIAPKTLVWSWDKEIAKFFPEMKRVVITELSPTERYSLWKSGVGQLFITSYSTAVNDYKILKDMEFDCIILDEAHHIKNSATKRFHCVKNLKSKFRLALTGTPIENHLKDIWTIFQFLMPGMLGKKAEIDRIERLDDHEKIERLAKITAPFILRRKKIEILTELPPIIVNECPVEMTTKQKEIYLSMLLRGRAEFLESGEKMSKIEILSLLTKLRLAANHPMMVSDSVTDFEESGKIAIIHELLEDIRESGGRTLIFSQFVKMLKLIEGSLLSRKIPYLYMDGSTTDRVELVDKFNSGTGEVFLLSLKVGGLGLNLTGADNVIIVDPWWNPAAEEQAFARAHRIGQSKQVVVSKLYSLETIEERIINMQQNKRELADFITSKAVNEPSKDFIKMLADLELDIRPK